jgi:hypothetical protein
MLIYIYMLLTFLTMHTNILAQDLTEAERVLMAESGVDSTDYLKFMASSFGQVGVKHVRSFVLSVHTYSQRLSKTIYLASSHILPDRYVLSSPV